MMFVVSSIRNFARLSHLRSHSKWDMMLPMIACKIGGKCTSALRVLIAIAIVLAIAIEFIGHLTGGKAIADGGRSAA